MGRMDLNPILGKELGADSRRFRTYAVRVAYVALLAAVVGVAAGPAFTSGRLLTVSQSAELGEFIFRIFAVVQFWIITLYAVLAGADLVAKEIRSDTLGLLALTLLTPGDLVRGKWLAAVAQAVSLMFCGLPILGFATYLGGAGALQIVGITVSTLCSVLIAAAVAVWASLRGTGLFGSVGLGIVGYLLILAVAAVPASMLAILGIDLFPSSHPWGSALASLSETSAGVPWVWSGAVSAGVIGIVLRSAAARLAGPEALAPRQVRSSRDIEAREEYARNARENLGLRRREHPVWERFPLLWKEIRTRSAAHVSYESRLIVGCSMVLLMISSLMMDLGDQLMVFHAFFPVALLLAVAGGAGLFIRDREDRRWEAVLGTPVTSRAIIGAKLLSGPASPEGLTLIGLALISLAPFLKEGRVLEAGLAVALYLTFAYCLAALASLMFRRQRTAMLLAGSIVASIPIGLPQNVLLGPHRALGSLNPYSYFTLWGDPGSLGVLLAGYAAAILLLGVAVLTAFRRVAGRP